MTPREVQRALRLITSTEFRRQRYFPISVLANMSGLSRECIYQARAGNLLTQRVVELLGPLLNDIIAGRMKATWQAGYGVDRVTVNDQPMEERWFFSSQKRSTGA
jgi:hypothetical protein